jgi:hypothetical protein
LSSILGLGPDLGCIRFIEDSPNTGCGSDVQIRRRRAK